jgi:two-component system NarL family sensor kinase
MPDKIYGEEVVMTVIIGVIVFLVVTSLMAFIILFYQKKRFQHQKQMAEKDKQYSEQLLRAQLEIQEQTFNAISSEVHDNVGQILSLAKVQLNIIDQGETLDKALLADAKESVGKALSDLRDIAKSLNSERIQQSGLYEVTEHELQRINRAGLMNTTLEKRGEAANIEDHKKLIIFRMIQESLHNIIKHSGATFITVNFEYKKEQLIISIADNGKGFDKSLLFHKDGLGLQNIFNRALLIGGHAMIDSTPGEGTIIIITSPYE